MLPYQSDKILNWQNTLLPFRYSAVACATQSCYAYLHCESEYFLCQINAYRCNLHVGRFYYVVWWSLYHYFGTLMPFWVVGVESITSVPSY